MSNSLKVDPTWYECRGEGPASIPTCCSSVVKTQQGGLILNSKAAFQAMYSQLLEWILCSPCPWRFYTFRVPWRNGLIILEERKEYGLCILLRSSWLWAGVWFIPGVHVTATAVATTAKGSKSICCPSCTIDVFPRQRASLTLSFRRITNTAQSDSL